MGARLRDRVHQAAQVAAALVLCALAGCGATAEGAEERAQRLLREGGAIIRADLEAILRACDRALGELDEALEEAGDDPARRFEALEDVRRRHGLTGLAWSGPGRERAWAGRTITPRDLPAPQPWQGSYETGPVIYHAGPFVRALVYGPVEAAGGEGTATWILDETGPYEEDARPFVGRWLEPLELFEVRLLHPADPSRNAPANECCMHLPVEGPDGSEVFVLSLHVHDVEVIQERMAAERSTVWGALLLLLLTGAVVAVRLGFVRIRPPVLRWLAGAVLVLVVRGLLRLMELPSRFPALGEAFSPSEFAVATPLGWLASPGDFALTAIAYLLVAICVTYAVRALPGAKTSLGRALTVAGGLAGTALACGLWLRLIEVAVEGGQTPFFQAHAFIPEAPAALMLTGLVAITATTFLIAHLLLRLAVRVLPALPGWATRTGLAAIAAAATWAGAALLATPHWVVLAIPLIASFVVPLGARRFGLALPSRVLVLSVLATGLAYPVLWERVATRESEMLEETLETILNNEDLARAGVAAALREAREDSYLRSGLRMASEGGRPEGLALHLWLRSRSHWQQEPVIVAVFDAAERALERFALDTLPSRLLPPAQPQGETADAELIHIAPGDLGQLRCVVGRLRVHAPDGEVLGYVVVTLPDRMDLRLRGLSGLVAGARRDAPMPLAADQRLQFAQLRDGRVVASSDPSLSRTPGSFGPPDLASLDADNRRLAWCADGRQGYARWSEARNAVFAVRQPERSMGDALLALARLVLVGVGCGLVAAIATLLAALGSFRLQLHHKILLSYFGISVIPLVLLGIASAREAQSRHEARLTERLQTDITRARGELEVMGPALFDSADSTKLEEWAPQRRHDVLLYRDGDLEAASRTGLVAAELLPSRLPPHAYRATVLERRQAISREARYAGRRVWFGFAPILDTTGATRATVGVPLLYEADRVEEQVTLTGSVLLAAYMLTLVLVLVGGIYVARRLTRPLGMLADGTKRVAAGDLDVELTGAGADELGQLVAAFNAMTEDLREMTEKAAQAERESAWRRMASQVAHEIKNPLTPMRLMLQQMEADVARDPSKASEALRRAAPIVLKQIASLDRIAGDFANFARLPKRRKTEVDAGELVAEVTALHSGAAGEGIVVRSEVADDLPRVYWDAEELRRVLLNVVLNAMESIEGRGEVTVRAEAARREGADGVRITVTDDGQGIERENIERLFEPQFSTKTRGTGLGLAIVSRILQDMGGTIDVESAPGEGSTFDLWWPVGGPADGP